jgi:branched-subunit amino acid ABC-type transport system permease component
MVVQEFVQFTVNGLLVGSLFATIAVGFALIWGVVDIINLAHGEMVMLGGYASYWLVQVAAGGEASLLVALGSIPVAIAVMYAIGYLLQRLLVQQVSDASVFLTLLITFGISIAIQQLAIIAWSADPRSTPVALADPSMSVAGIVVPKLKSVAFVGALVLTALLWVYLQRTRRGRAIRAVAQNPQAAELVGIDVEHTRAVTFGLSAAIAGGAGGFIGMILSLRPQMGLIYTLKSFVIVVFGGIGSIPGALVGGLALGAVEQLVTGFISSTWTLAVSFSLLIVLLVVKPSGLFGQSIEGGDGGTRSGSSLALATPDSLREVALLVAGVGAVAAAVAVVVLGWLDIASLTVWAAILGPAGVLCLLWATVLDGERLWALFGLVVVTLALLQLSGPLPAADASAMLVVIGALAILWDVALDRARQVLDRSARHGWALLAAFAVVAVIVKAAGLLGQFWTTVAIQLYIFGVLALSWDLLGGQTGYPSFGNMAFFGVGAYTSAILFKTYGVSLPLSFAAAALAALVFAAVIGLLVLRLQGGYFAIATLGVLLVAIQVARNLDITGGPDGIILLDVPPQSVFYYALLGTLVAEVAVVYYLLGSRFGYVLNTIRDDEGKAIAMGINTTYYKTAAWMLAALFTGLVGAMWAPYNTFVDPQQAFNTAWNVEFIVMAFLGGTGTIAGPVLGAFGLWALVLQIDTFFPGVQLIVLGLVVIVTVVQFPDGVVGQLRERASAMEYYKHGGGAAGDPASDADIEPEGGDD